MRMRLARWIAPLLVLPMAAVGCDNAPTGAGGGQGTLAIRLSDAAGDVQSAWVEITDVYLQGDGGRVDLPVSTSGFVKLTDLTDGASASLVDQTPIDAGSYSQLRFVIGGAAIQLDNGDVWTTSGVTLDQLTDVAAGSIVGSLKCPSCSQSGLKVNLPGGSVSVSDNQQIVAVDFDVTQSFGQQAGMSGMWVMHPVMNATVFETGALPGSISGTVALGDAVTIPECPSGTPRDVTDFVPTATAETLTDGSGDPIMLTTSVAADGSFTFDNLSPDTYDLSFQSEVTYGSPATDQLTFTATVDPGSEDVGAGQDVTGVTYTITGATCDAVGGSG